MWQRRLLSERGERGSAPAEFVFVALFATFLLFGVIEVALALYGRNVVASSAHEAARAAIELHASASRAEAIAHNTVRRSTGSLVEGYEVTVSSQSSNERVVVRVRVRGHLDAPGPLPLRIPVDLSATAAREVLP